MALVPYQTLEQAFQAYVVGTPSLSALIGTRMYPLIAPQSTDTPYGRYRVISTVRTSSHSGPSKLSRPRIQVDWVGDSKTQAFLGYEQAKDVAEAARRVLHDFRGLMLTIRVHRCELVDERDFVDDDLELVGRSQDYMVWHRED